MVPIADVDIEDIWHLAGMRGTGSNTVVAQQILVPRHRFIPLSAFMTGVPAIAANRGAICQVPFASAAATDLSGPTWTGPCRHGVGPRRRRPQRHHRAPCTTSVPTPRPPNLRWLRPRSPEKSPNAGLRLRRRRRRSRNTGHLPGLAVRARNQMRTAQAIVHAREAIRTLISIQGSDAFTEDSPLQRIWRDSEVVSRHAVCNPAISAQVYGRGLLGYTDNLMPMV